MYKYLFIIILASLFFLVNIFSDNISVFSGKELIKLLQKETGGSNILFRQKPKIDMGNQELNRLNTGYYVMFEKTDGEKSLFLLSDNTAKFIFPLNENTKITERGYWRTRDDEKVEVIIIGNQYGNYDDARVFIFEPNYYDKKLISTSYEKIIYGDGGLVFYRK